MKLVFPISENDSEIELQHCSSSKTSVKSSRKYFVHLKGIKLATNPRVGSIVQWVERWSRNPKMRVEFPLETTNFSLISLYSAVSDKYEISFNKTNKFQC